MAKPEGKIAKLPGKPRGAPPPVEHQFKPGQTGNANGRPKGARTALCSQFIEDLLTVWSEQGEQGSKGLETLRKIAQEKPVSFMIAVSQLVPKEFDMGDKSQAGFRDFLEMLTSGKFKPREYDPKEDDNV